MFDWALLLSRATAALPKQAPQHRPHGHSRSLHLLIILGRRQASYPSKQQEPQGSSRYSNPETLCLRKLTGQLSAVKGLLHYTSL